LNLKMVMIIGIPLLLLFAIVVYFTMPWIAIYLGIQSEPNPPSPTTKYGEFPFRLEYEIDGKRMVIQDTLICEYDGVGADEGRGKYRKWKQRLASGEDRLTLLKLDENKEIIFPPGDAQYYMGDRDDTSMEQTLFPNALLLKKEGRITIEELISADQLLDEYNIKLISWNSSEPIKNSFK
jgi:hypothetical protein